ncbi:6-hydroxymethylpterin diphosphokinase MptE-like protein [Shewanella fidelis]|uniref:motility associated factor glycosyltransferase family protein n=1 Tax=Shewanella fidelis TaxID=173509 RepID=UPI00048F225E|nr:6-hydroxymethylpterin diphosphokinase MptE-like protein [Shewanella fidelis]
MNVSDSIITNQFSVSNFGEYYLPSVNRDTFEKIDSKTAFKQRFKQHLFKEDTLHIIIGLDSGLLANYILSQPIPNGSKYIFVELDEVLNLLNIDIEPEFQPYVQVLSMEQFAAHLESGDDDLYLIKDQCLTHNSIASTMGIIEQYSHCIKFVHKQIMLRTVEKKSYFEQKAFLVQQLKNLADNQYPASLLDGKFQGKTCIVIGGGPSLDDHIDWIKQHYDDLFILTVSRMAARLSSENIPAHIIVSVDPQDVSFEVNRDMMSLSKESLFINSHHVNHRLLSQWQGKSLFLGPKLPWLKEDYANIPTVGPTVTNSAVRIAIRLGFNTILLTGADFCFSSKGVSHAKGALEASAGANNSKIGEWVQTYAGHMAETPVQLIYAAQALNEEALKHPQVNIINLSENAVKLDGVSYQSVAEVKLEPAKVSPKDLLNMLPSVAESTAKHLDEMLSGTENAVKAFETITALSTQAISLNAQARKHQFQSKQHQKIIDKINAIEEQLNKQFDDFCQVIKFYGYFEFSKFLTTKDSKNWSVEQMQEMTRLYYKAFKSISIELVQYLTETISLLKVRLAELQPSADFDWLIDQWRIHNQPGRIHVVLQLREQLNLDVTMHQSQFDAIANDYQHQLASMEHAYFSIGSANKSLHNTLAKVVDLYKSQNMTGLSQLIENIKPMTSSDALAQRLHYLALCYWHILDKNDVAALDALQQIDKQNRTEVELKQLLLLALKLHNIDLAENTLEKIIAYSDEYLSQYAHVLSLQGKNQQALNAYLDYLDKYPTDISVLLKLGVFLAEMGQIDGARSSFEQVLIIDPDNLTAPNYLQQLQA